MINTLSFMPEPNNAEIGFEKYIKSIRCRISSKALEKRGKLNLLKAKPEY